MFDVFAMICQVKMRWILTCVAAGFLLAVTPAGAQDYEATRHAAEQGDASAQYFLGFAYANGRGVPEDDVTAHMWLNVAAATGDEAARMTREQIAEAQARAREWANRELP